MTIVIPVKSGTNPIELKYAIRSLLKSFNEEVDICIIGDKIYSLRGLKYVSCQDDKSSKHKERNIYLKILKAIDSRLVSHDFCFMNDDHFLTQSFDLNSLPFYHKGELENTMQKNAGDYRKSLNHTRKFLLSQGKSTLDFDTHFPIIYNKDKFINTFVGNNLNWQQPFGYVIKSLYCNLNDIKGEFGGDCKIQSKLSYEEIQKKIEGRTFFSTSDGCMNDAMIRTLEELYGEPSKYEK